MSENCSPAAPKPSFRTFLILWVTQSISVFGSALTFFCITVWLTQSLYPLPEQRPQLSIALSMVGLAWGIPGVFLSPIAGAWADRHDRRKIMMVTDIGSGLLSLLLMWLLATDQIVLPLLLALMAIFSTLGIFHSLAFDTSYAMIVPREMLPRANGMMQTMWALSNVLSPAMAALLLAMPALARQGRLWVLSGMLAPLKSGAPIAIFLDAVTFFVAAAVLVFLAIPSPKRQDLRETSGKTKSLFKDVTEGALYIWHRRPLLMLLGTFAMVNFIGSFLGVFQPLIVKFNLAADWQSMGFTFETALATLTSIGGVGGVLGGFAISAWGGLRSKRVYGVLVPILIETVVLIVFGLSTALYLSAGLVFVLMALSPTMNAHSQAIWQTQTPPEIQGRVFSVRRLVAQCTFPLGTAIAGWAGGLSSPGIVITTLGVLGTLFMIVQFMNPRLLRVEDKEWLESLALESQRQ